MQKMTRLPCHYMNIIFAGPVSFIADLQTASALVPQAGPCTAQHLACQRFSLGSFSQSRGPFNFFALTERSLECKLADRLSLFVQSSLCYGLQTDCRAGRPPLRVSLTFLHQAPNFAFRMTYFYNEAVRLPQARGFELVRRRREYVSRRRTERHRLL